MTGSKLVTYTRASPNYSAGRGGQKVWIFTPHCVVGQCTLPGLGEWFSLPSRRASCTYGISYDGKIGQYVDERNRPWTTSSSWNDNRAITVEVASDTFAPYYMTEKAYASLVKLGADVAVRYGKIRMVWPGCLENVQCRTWPDDTMVLTAHRWYAATACPGEWLYGREEQLAADINKRIEEIRDMTASETEAMIRNLTPQLISEYHSAREADLSDDPIPNWAADDGEYARAKEMGITDGSRPMAYATRLEGVLFAYRAMEKGMKTLSAQIAELQESVRTLTEKT